MTTLLHWSDSDCSDYWNGYKCLSCKTIFSVDTLSRIFCKTVKQENIISKPKFCPNCGKEVLDIKELENSKEEVETFRRPKARRYQHVFHVKSRIVDNKFSDWHLERNIVCPPIPHDDPLYHLKYGLLEWKEAIKRDPIFESEFALIRYDIDSPCRFGPGIGDGKIVKQCVRKPTL